MLLCKREFKIRGANTHPLDKLWLRFIRALMSARIYGAQSLFEERDRHLLRLGVTIPRLTVMILRLAVTVSSSQSLILNNLPAQKLRNLEQKLGTQEIGKLQKLVRCLFVVS